MTRDSVIQMLMIIQASYPNYKPPDKTVTVNMWHEMLQEYDEASAMTALKEFIKTDTSGFAPSIGQIIAKIDLVRKRNEINSLEQMLLQESCMRIGETRTRMIGSE
jgi:hypothetical protein